MSGITPILDTLLHQVLGWQRDATASPALPDKLIPPPRPAQPAAAAHSDSRLDPRVPQTAARGVAAERAPSARTTGGYDAAATRAGDAAAVARFSAAARAIGDILARYPEAAAVVRAQAPLLNAAGRADVAALAQALGASVAASGLFYEAHLRRWSNGTYPLAQLAREPQMVQARRGGGANLPVLSHGPADDAGAPVVRAGLEDIVRQQLELLAAPVLRWEGEAWPGLSMAMTLTPPWWRDGPDDPCEGDESGQEAADAWRSTLVLRLRNLGEVAVDLRLGATWVAIGVRASPAAAGHLQAASGELRRRIRGAGFRHVRVHIAARAGSGGARHG